MRIFKPFAIAALALVFAAFPVAADLGEAENSTSGQTTFDVWCSKRKTTAR